MSSDFFNWVGNSSILMQENANLIVIKQCMEEKLNDHQPKVEVNQ